MVQEQEPAGVLAPAAEPERPTGRGLLVGAAKFALAGVILYVLFRRGEIHLGQLGAALSHWWIPLLVVVLTAVSYFGQAFRWVLLLRSRDIHVRHWDAFRYLMIGKFFNLAVPGYFSEDFVRGLYLIRGRNGSRSKVVVSLVVDRVTGVFVLLLISVAGLLLRPSTLDDPRLGTMLGMSLAGIAAIFALVLFLRLCPQPHELLRRGAERLRLHVAVDKVYAEARHYAVNLRLQAVTIAISLFNQGLMVACFGFFGQTLGMTGVHAADYLIFVPLGVLATMLPVAPLGLGVGHVAFLTLFKLAGSGEGANLFSLYTAVVILLSLTGGLFYLGNRGRNR